MSDIGTTIRTLSFVWIGVIVGIIIAKIQRYRRGQKIGRLLDMSLEMMKIKENFYEE